MRASLIPSSNLLTLAEAIANHILKRSLDTLTVRNIKLNAPKFSAIRRFGSVITVIQTLAANTTTCLILCLTPLHYYFQFPFFYLFLLMIEFGNLPSAYCCVCSDFFHFGKMVYVPHRITSQVMQVRCKTISSQ